MFIVLVTCCFQGAHPWLVSDHSPKSVSPPAVMAWSTVSFSIFLIIMWMNNNWFEHENLKHILISCFCKIVLFHFRWKTSCGQRLQIIGRQLPQHTLVSMETEMVLYRAMS